MGVLLTAPLPRCLLSMTADQAHAVAERKAWIARFTVAMRALFCMLYCVTGVAKLNEAWFDYRYSCSVQMAAAALGDYLPSSPVLLALLPPMAVGFELTLPPLVLIAHCVEHSCTSLARRTLRLCAVGGSFFHMLLALPPPPLSVYPFSMLMAPIYLLLLPNEFAEAARLILHMPRRVRGAAEGGAAVLVFAALMASRRSNLFEYPPYFSWELGVLWVSSVFTAMILAALFSCAPTQRCAREATVVASAGNSSTTENEQSVGSLRLFLAILPAATLGLIGVLPYIGIRSHVSLTMFSNLRVEADASNHLLIPNWLTRISGGMSVSHSIQVLNTDLPSFTYAQVNLGPLLPNGTLSTLRRLNLSTEFYISPPKW
eukprot:CAMPEP_0119304640 /NCGR_PEP_ID=MMETSP1333-20130426/5812_1 /TAXON_ID=418940 /ORGANISM="Scyphosphaera apsteinii, Strain RCC1455" /LENGTH=372 /DNA_ID=CAMNT_0007307559 /DNA_START=396 /DNA_END=1511 /DNA_ORIENTATION=-